MQLILSQHSQPALSQKRVEDYHQLLIVQAPVIVLPSPHPRRSCMHPGRKIESGQALGLRPHQYVTTNMHTRRL